MGVDCNIWLSPATRVDDVKDVLAGLLGLRREQMPLGQNGEWAVRSYDIYVSTTTIPEMVRIEWRHGPDFKPDGFASYFFEAGRNGERLLSCKSTAFWIAAGKRLVSFFGGKLIARDTDDRVQLRATAPKWIHATDGKAWETLQQAMWDVIPLSAAELAKADRLAAYK